MALQIHLPQQEVILPLTGKSVVMQAMTMKHRMQILESEILTMSERLNFICKLAFDRLVTKEAFNVTGEKQQDYYQFLQNLYEVDLYVMIYGILQATYRKPYNFRVLCETCGHVNTVPVPISDMILSMQINQGGQDKYYTEIYEKDIEYLGLKFQLIVPTMYHIINGFKYAEAKDINVLAEVVKADNIASLIYKIAPYILLPAIHSIQDAEGNVVRNNITSKKAMDQILEVLEQIPEDDVAELLNFVEELKSRYYMEFGFKYVCQNPECPDHKSKKAKLHKVDLIEEFFPINIERLLGR